MRVSLIQLKNVETFLVDPAGGGLPSFSFVDVDVPVPDACFALECNEFKANTLLLEDGIAIFASRLQPGDARDQIYLLRYPDGCPRLCRLVRSEQAAGGREVFRPSRRKSFMTPTPLHIPTSTVSPIPDYTHSVYYLKPWDQEKLEVVSTDQSRRLLPLVFVQHRLENSG